jgi:chorismate synthase
VEHAVTGRHDPSIVIRAVPVVEAMTLMVIADMMLMAQVAAS